MYLNFKLLDQELLGWYHQIFDSSILAQGKLPQFLSRIEVANKTLRDTNLRNFTQCLGYEISTPSPPC